ncbi:hypothetical protein D1007_01639 [Hordeum vulgare]|nr:hypothetical protein D1007_01639 [Hordeum vulgare]
MRAGSRFGDVCSSTAEDVDHLVRSMYGTETLVCTYADLKELKRQRNKEYYARNKDAILERRREACEKKQASTPMLTDQQNQTNTPLSMSRAVDPIELQMQMVGEHYSHNVDDVFSAQLQAEQENETQTPVSMSIGNDA